MPRYRNPKTGVVVDIPAELAESMGIYAPIDSAPVEKSPAKSEQDEKPNPTRRKSSTRRKLGDD